MAKQKTLPNKIVKRSSPPSATTSLLGDLRQLIKAAREQTTRAVNSSLVTMYWQIGKRTQQDVLQEVRAGHGMEIVQTLSAQLTTEYGQGFGGRNLFQMVRFAEVFSNMEIVAALSQQLSGSHFVELIPLEDSLKRDFYAEICRVERWSVRTLQHKIGHLDLRFSHRRLRCLIAIDSEAGQISGGRQRSNGTVSPLARKGRRPSRRRDAPRPDPVRRQIRSAHRTAATERTRNPRRPIPDRTSATRTAGKETARFNPPRPRTFRARRESPAKQRATPSGGDAQRERLLKPVCFLTV